MTAAAPRRPLGLLIVLCVIGAGLIVLAPTRPAVAAFSWGSGGRVNGYEAALIRYVNAARQAHGIPALTNAVGTNDLARRWAARMAGTSVLAHNPSLTSQLPGAGSPSWRVVAENVGYASACSPKQLFDAYMASSGHRANILDRRMR